MDDSIFGTNAEDFDDRHIQYHRVQHWRIVRYRREKELMRKIRAHSVAVSAEEAGLANKQFFQRISVELPPRVREMYDQLVEEFILEWEGGLITAKNAGVKRLRLLQLTGGFDTSGQCFHTAKLDRLKAYGKLLLAQGESVLVYSRFSPEVDASFDVLDSLGFHAHRVAGSTSNADRRRALSALRRPPSEPTAISFQYQAGSRALELVGAAETVFYGPSDSWVDYWGALKRTQGPNQARPCRYTHLIAPGTVDVTAIKGLRHKEDLHQRMMRNPRRFLQGM
jgi:SNF2 family DNA or RNA helicase